MTNGSLTATQMISFTPFAFKPSAPSTKPKTRKNNGNYEKISLIKHRQAIFGKSNQLPGKCVFEQPGVNAPGTPNITTLPSLQTSARLTLSPGVPSNRSPFGTASPTCVSMVSNNY